jgi:hypothetical protein
VDQTIHEIRLSCTKEQGNKSFRKAEPNQFIATDPIHLVSIIKLRKDDQQDAKKGAHADTYSDGDILGL